MNEEIAQLKAQVAELMAWKEERQIQQLAYPVDEASKNALGAVVTTGISTYGTQSVSVPSTPTNITVPQQPDGTLLIRTQDGALYKIPYIV